MSTALVAPSASFSQEQIDIIKSQVAPKGTTNDELAMFLQYCQRTGLDPFARQIYLSERRAKDQQTGNWTVSRKPETTIDGFRVIAERNGQYAGQLGPFWCGSDGQWRDVWVAQEPPVAARVGILRHDFKEPLWAVALYEEYVQTAGQGNEKRPNSMWAKMPANQLAKCAESLALRRAFPRELSGLYTREEMPSEQHEAKQAQADYLASKGLEPYVADKKLPPATKPETIRELAETLDQPSTKTIEMRHAARQNEAQAILDEAQRDQDAKKGRSGAHGCIPLDKLANWRKLKDEIRSYTGTDDIYKSALKAKGYEHANEIQTQKEATAIWTVLGAERTRLKLRDENIKTLEEAATVIGQRAFGDLLGLHGAETIEDALALSGDAWAALIKELTEVADGLKSKS